MTFVRRALTQGEVDLLVQAHERLAEGRPGGRRLALKFADLNGLNLSGRNLAEADLTGCSLENTRLVGTRLESAVLFCCDLRGADFEPIKNDAEFLKLRGN